MGEPVLPGSSNNELENGWNKWPAMWQWKRVLSGLRKTDIVADQDCMLSGF